MLHTDGLVQRLAELASQVGVRRGRLRRFVVTSACLCVLALPSAQAAENSDAITPAATTTSSQPANPAPATSDQGSVPVQTAPQTTPAPNEPTVGQSQATVNQPPGVSGYLPVDYLLIFFVAALIAFLATRPGTGDAIKALGKLISGGGPGNPPA